MIHYFSFIFGAIITLVLLVPFGFAAGYAFLSLKQLLIADKEKSNLKRKSGVVALAVSVTGMVMILFIWWHMMAKI